MENKIMIAEDDPDIVELLRLYLDNAGFEVCYAYDGLSALKLFEQEQPDAVIADIMMPGITGFELTKRIRETSGVPIIILSAKKLDSDKILGLDIGADDYVTKPFNPLEIIARVKAQLRRVNKLSHMEPPASSADVIKIGALELDTKALTLTKNGEDIPITPTEYKILAMLMESPGRVFTRVQIYERINGEYFGSDDNTMMVHISKLRDKIEDDSKKPEYLKTIRGLGYKFEKR
ncbi:MAG: response regulator transcription factor [Ruminococcus sp.]|nr:response regulator transcription factor [Ruminococcus sp.]